MFRERLGGSCYGSRDIAGLSGVFSFFPFFFLLSIFSENDD